jgi:hypothetical protein
MRQEIIVSTKSKFEKKQQVTKVATVLSHEVHKQHLSGNLGGTYRKINLGIFLNFIMNSKVKSLRLKQA